MPKRLVRCAAALLLACAIEIPEVRAQFAVIDVASVAQLLHQVATMASQLEAAQAQLEQARAQYQSLTGGRGMETLLAGTVRNYLPMDGTQISTVLQGGVGSYAQLATDLQRNLDANSILPTPQLAALPADSRAQLGAARSAVALLQAVSQEALANASSRFAGLQQLIDAIPSAQDAKAALDLQTRIAAEQGMLQNEQTKLQVLYQLALAQQWAVREQAQERTATAHGIFASRFEPTPF